MKYLVDTSAMTLKDERARRRIDLLRATGQLAISPVTVMELLYTAQNGPGWVRGLSELNDLPHRDTGPQEWARAISVQGLLARQGKHRSPSIPDLLVAATAELSGLIVLHCDKDFPLIGSVTGQQVERVVPVPDGDW